MSIPEAARALDGLVRAVSLLICFLVFSEEIKEKMHREVGRKLRCEMRLMLYLLYLPVLLRAKYIEYQLLQQLEVCDEMQQDLETACNQLLSCKEREAKEEVGCYEGGNVHPGLKPRSEQAQ
ncbi:hypothetical protein AK812_SmicGene42613 [Symbiodinium microadriaticum]|uniref:Uncharacterized protein n=1 Tax=Symbiodinium microadriaticum TaxID=2951 RepID=A0A1Q9C352_SYMMI|nr:hypothetical protein AK812_SmicGene42613 [Symbiodinium microadriaticum]